MEPTIDQLHEFIQAARRAAARGLLRCSSGNLSCRIDDDHMLVSGTQTWLETITPVQIATCRIDDASPLGNVKPSVEARFHAGILRHRSDARCVLHFQSPAATALACRSAPPGDMNVIIEVPYYIGRPGWVDFHMPGSKELARAVIDAARDHDVVMMRNHGLVAVGTGYDDVIQRAAFFELACEILLRGGSRTVTIPPADADELRRRATEGLGGA